MVNTFQQIHLGNRLQAEGFQRVDEQTCLYPIAGEEGELLQGLAPPRVLAGERLDQTRKPRKKKVDQRPRGQLRHPPAATGD